MAAVLNRHRISAFGPEDAACSCDRTWRPHDDYRAHVAAALLAAGFGDVAAAKAEGAAEFAAWVAYSRAYNGSDYLNGQSLYNECINAALPKWAMEWADEREAKS